MAGAPTRIDKAPSEVAAASNAFVAAHLADAAALGERLVRLVADPDAFVAAILEGFRALADPVNADGARAIAPGLGQNLGVRLPLMEAAHSTFKRGTRQSPPSLLLNVMDRLLSEELPEIRWFGIWNLARLLPVEPERTWQLLRRAACEAHEWITVDTLAQPFREGILRDRRRWAELDTLVLSPSRWERRLVGSTLATMSRAKVPAAERQLVVQRGLPLLEQLIGDPEPDVQKALSWALRTFAPLDQATVTAFAEAEAQTARRNQDGNRAWVIRDSLSKLPDETAAYLRASLDGIRRGSKPTTSRAADAAVEFAAAGAAPRPGQGLPEE